MSYHKPDEKTLQALKDIANKLRIHSIKQTCASNSGLSESLYRTQMTPHLVLQRC